MIESYELLAILIVIGLATGAITGLTGASGMSILISALLVAGIETRKVIGLTFVITLANSAISLGSYWKHGHVDLRSGVLVAVPAILGVLGGYRVSHAVETGWLTGVLIVCLFAVGVKFLFAAKEKERSESETSRQPHTAILVIIGSVAGILMGLMGGGGAVFIGIALILLFKMDTKTAIGTSIFIMGMAAIPGVAVHSWSQTIPFLYATIILATSLPAALIASWYANRISQRLVKRLLGLYLVVISTVLVCRAVV